jgi:deoxyribodipyrimidine photolyase-related protein
MLGIVFPHQCFKAVPSSWTQIWFVRHDIGYGGKKTVVADFHIARKIFLRAAEKAWIKAQKVPVRVIGRGESWSTKEACEVWDPVDQLLEAEIRRSCPRATVLPTPAFLLTDEEALQVLGDGGHDSHAAFYGEMRRRTGILMTASGKPEGGRLRFDTENRQPLRDLKQIPDWSAECKAREGSDGAHVKAAAREIETEGGGLGEWTGQLVFPVSHKAAKQALRRFIQRRLALFGPYQDAIVSGEEGDFLFHSVLSAPINAGILTPAEVLEEVVSTAGEKVPLQSLEGFVAQLLGWREFMRAVYLKRPSAPANRLHHRRKLTAAWYTGETGLDPVDGAIERVRCHAYLHHIERLMVVGNAMFLCGIRPADVYQWFTEMFADSYDWVMVGNVYYMSQWASDAITTKPYMSSSAYILRMSNWPRGDWTGDWDALYWATVARLAGPLRHNYRMAAQVSFWEKKTAAEKRELLARAESVLRRITKSG